jgi:hypothetical protein
MAFGGACESEIAERQVDAFGLKLIFKLDKSALVKTKQASGRREEEKVACSLHTPPGESKQEIQTSASTAHSKSRSFEQTFVFPA